MSAALRKMAEDVARGARIYRAQLEGGPDITVVYSAKTIALEMILPRWEELAALVLAEVQE